MKNVTKKKQNSYFILSIFLNPKFATESSSIVWQYKRDIWCVKFTDMIIIMLQYLTKLGKGLANNYAYIPAPRQNRFSIFHLDKKKKRQWKDKIDHFSLIFQNVWFQ